jgi:hypothetical protein
MFFFIVVSRAPRVGAQGRAPVNQRCRRRRYSTGVTLSSVRPASRSALG